MGVNLNDWLGQHLWVLWLVAAGLLASAEMLTGDLVLLMLAGGALAGVAAALLFPGLWWIQVIIAVVVAVGMLVLLRPTLLAKIRNAPGYRSSLAKMVGSAGVASAEITASGGEAKVGGDTWTARSYDSSVIPAGTKIEVFEVDGTTVVVHPVDKPLS